MFDNKKIYIQPILNKLNNCEVQNAGRTKNSNNNFIGKRIDRKNRQNQEWHSKKPFYQGHNKKRNWYQKMNEQEARDHISSSVQIFKKLEELRESLLLIKKIGNKNIFMNNVCACISRISQLTENRLEALGVLETVKLMQQEKKKDHFSELCKEYPDLEEYAMKALKEDKNGNEQRKS